MEISKDILFENYTQTSSLSVEIVQEFEQDSEKFLKDIINRVEKNLYEEEVEERAPIYEKRDGLQVASSNEAIFDEELEAKNHEETFYEFCDEWKEKFIHLRIVGTGLSNSEDQFYFPSPPEITESERKKQTDEYLLQCRNGGLVEEIISSDFSNNDGDSQFGEIFAVDNDLALEHVRVKNRMNLGFPPFSPKEFVEDFFVNSLIRDIWELVTPKLLPLIEYMFVKWKENSESMSSSEGRTSGSRSLRLSNLSDEMTENGTYIDNVNLPVEEDLEMDEILEEEENIDHHMKLAKPKTSSAAMYNHFPRKPFTQLVTQNIKYGLDNSLRIMAMNKGENNMAKRKKIGGQNVSGKRKNAMERFKSFSRTSKRQIGTSHRPRSKHMTVNPATRQANVRKRFQNPGLFPIKSHSNVVLIKRLGYTGTATNTMTNVDDEINVSTGNSGITVNVKRKVKFPDIPQHKGMNNVHLNHIRKKISNQGAMNRFRAMTAISPKYMMMYKKSAKKMYRPHPVNKIDFDGNVKTTKGHHRRKSSGIGGY